MAKHRVGAVVVVHDGAVVGMVWERDLIRLLHELGASLVNCPVSEIRNVDVISCMLTDEVDGILRSVAWPTSSTGASLKIRMLGTFREGHVGEGSPGSEPCREVLRRIPAGRRGHPAAAE